MRDIFPEMLQAFKTNIVPGFRGRLPRREFLLWIVFQFITGTLLSAALAFLYSHDIIPVGSSIIIGIVFILSAVWFLIANLGSLIQRLHDVGKSGFWLLLFLSPLLPGAIALLMFRNGFGWQTTLMTSGVIGMIAQASIPVVLFFLVQQSGRDNKWGDATTPCVRCGPAQEGDNKGASGAKKSAHLERESFQIKPANPGKPYQMPALKTPGKPEVAPEPEVPGLFDDEPDITSEPTCSACGSVNLRVSKDGARRGCLDCRNVEAL